VPVIKQEKKQNPAKNRGLSTPCCHAFVMLLSCTLLSSQLTIWPVTTTDTDRKAPINEDIEKMMHKNRTLLISVLLTGTLLTQGCSTTRVHANVDRDCPAPTKDQLHENGMLKLQNEVTLKCQVKNFTNQMSCAGITDGKDDAWVCDNGTKKSVFIFNEKGILKTSKFY
jgi:hypothetical protein